MSQRQSPSNRHSGTGVAGVESMERAEVRRLLVATGEEIFDESGNVIGYVAQPARFRLSKPDLARGGFLVVVRDEETAIYVGTEYDALPHPKTSQPYPAGHSEVAWRTENIDVAVDRVLHALASPESGERP